MNPHSFYPRRPIIVFLSALMLVAIAGCNSAKRYVNQQYNTTLGPKRTVENVLEMEALPNHIRRIAMLPIHKGAYGQVDMSVIEQNFYLELSKLSLFEIVHVTPEAMREMFEKERFSSVDYLPTKLLTRLHEVYGTDGVMLIDVSYYEPYNSVGLGIRAKLFDGHKGEIIWAVDEVFDSSDPSVSNAARSYYQNESLMKLPLNNSKTVLSSPNRFSKYVASAVFSAISLQKN